VHVFDVSVHDLSARPTRLIYPRHLIVTKIDATQNVYLLVFKIILLKKFARKLAYSKAFKAWNGWVQILKLRTLHLKPCKFNGQHCNTISFRCSIGTYNAKLSKSAPRVPIACLATDIARHSSIFERTGWLSASNPFFVRPVTWKIHPLRPDDARTYRFMSFVLITQN